MRDDLHNETGLNAIVALMGFCGGVLSLAHIKRLTVPWALGAVASGTICAVVLTQAVEAHYQLSGPYENALAFFIGIGGMSIVGKIHEWWLMFDLKRVTDSKLSKLDRDE